jgi:hypothetical protein
MTKLSASRYSPMFREQRSASASASASASVSASVSASASARIGLLAPDCAGIISQNT